MSETYVKSSNIKVYPSALRSGTDNNVSQYIFNPESRLNTEYNAASRINALTNGKCFVTSFTSPDMTLCMHGYLFEVDLTDILTTFASSSNIYARVKLQDIATWVQDGSVQVSYTINSLTNISGTEASAPLDVFAGSGVPTPTGYEFRGLIFSDSKMSSPVSGQDYELLILQKVSGTWTVPVESFGKLNAKDVLYTDTSGNVQSLETILQGGSTSASKLSTARTIWGQSFDGTANVSGNMSGVGAINSTNGKDIGTQSNKFGTVYANEFAVTKLKKWDTSAASWVTNVGDSNQLLYVKNGEITPGMKIWSGTTAPSSTTGNVGDIYIQYTK